MGKFMKRFGLQIILIFQIVASASALNDVGSDSVIVCDKPQDQTSPQIVSSDSDHVIITWEDYRSGNDYDIYAQRLLPNGTNVWTPGGIAISAATDDQI